MFDITLTGALLAGLLSFLSPCVLPMVPFYLSYLAGASIQQAGDGPIPVAVRNRAVLAAILFALGVTTIFVGLGAAATTFGQLVRDWFDVLRWIAAAIIIGMGPCESVQSQFSSVGKLAAIAAPAVIRSGTSSASR